MSELEPVCWRYTCFANAESFKERVRRDNPLLFLDKSRQELLHRTAYALMKPMGQGHNTLVLGQRAVGKTVMLNALVRAARGARNRWGPLYSLYINGSLLDAEFGPSSNGFGPWLAAKLGEQSFPQDLVFPGTTGRRAFEVIDKYLAKAGGTLFLVLDEVDIVYKHAWGRSVLSFFLTANNSVEARHRVRFILSGSAAVTRGLCYIELPDGMASWTGAYPVYATGSFNSRKCVPFQLQAPATVQEFCDTVLRVCCEAANASGEIHVELAEEEPDSEALDDSDAEEASGGPPTTSAGAGDSDAADGTGSDPRPSRRLLLPPSFAKELFTHYRGQIDKLQEFIQVFVDSKSVKAAMDALPSIDTMVAGVPHETVQRHFKALWQAMGDEDRLAAPECLFAHSLTDHAAALGVPCDTAFVREIHTLCDKGVLATPGGPRAAPNVVGFAHPADMIHASVLFPSSGQ